MKILIALIGIAFLATSCGGKSRTGLDNEPVLSAVAPPGEATILVVPEIVAPPPRPAAPRLRTPRVAEPFERRQRVVAAAVAPRRTVVRWTSYKRFRFERNTSDLQPADSGAVSEIAAYLARSPSVGLGLDGTDTRDADLGRRRVAALQSALVKAGVPGSRIEAGAFGTSRIRRDQNVEVLLISR